MDLQTRVKHLDQEDIESLGWTKKSNDKYQIRDFIFQFNEEFPTSEVLIFKYDIDTGMDYYFQGNIKNKSELKKLMQQLEII